MLAKDSWSACLLLAAVAACGDASDPGPCRRRAVEIATSLRTMNHEISPFYAEGAKLVTRADVPPVRLPSASTVHARADGVSIDGRAVADRSELQELMALRVGDGRPATQYHDPSLVHVVVDEDAPWETVVWVAAALHDAGFLRPAFGFRYPATETKPPPRSKIDPELDALIASDDASSKATQFAKLASKVVDRCKPLAEAFGDVAGVEGESKADTLIAAIEPSLVTCHCSLDVASFHSLMYRLLYVAEATTSVRVQLTPDGAKLALPAATPWREAAPRFAADQAVWLTVQ